MVSGTYWRTVSRAPFELMPGLPTVWHCDFGIGLLRRAHLSGLLIHLVAASILAAVRSIRDDGLLTLELRVDRIPLFTFTIQSFCTLSPMLSCSGLTNYRLKIIQTNEMVRRVAPTARKPAAICRLRSASLNLPFRAFSSCSQRLLSSGSLRSMSLIARK